MTIRPHTALAGALLVLSPAAQAQDGTMPPPELVEAVRGGSHVVFVRHAQTEADYADQVDAVMGDCSTQRTLSETG